MRIVIDPGHGGRDPGAYNPRLLLTEAGIVLSYGIILRATLTADKHEIVMTREENEFIFLKDRVQKANDVNADLFLSLHCNASNVQKANGIEVWTYPGQTDSDTFAEALYREIAKEFFHRKMRIDTSDGDKDKEARFYVLKHTRMPAVLLELGFVTNDSEAEWLRDFQTIHKYCQAISRSLDTWRVA
jgi:N-acetylmuramoyl-L-alanine amidase